MHERDLEIELKTIATPLFKDLNLEGVYLGPTVPPLLSLENVAVIHSRDDPEFAVVNADYITKRQIIFVLKQLKQ